MASSICTMSFLLLLLFVCSLFPPHTCDPDHAIDGHEVADVDTRARVAKKGVKLVIIPCFKKSCTGSASASGVSTNGGSLDSECWCCEPTKDCFWQKETCWAICPHYPPSQSHSP